MLAWAARHPHLPHWTNTAMSALRPRRSLPPKISPLGWTCVKFRGVQSKFSCTVWHAPAVVWNFTGKSGDVLAHRMRLLRTTIDEAVQHQAEASLHGGERHHGVLFVDEADDLLAVEQPPDI